MRFFSEKLAERNVLTPKEADSAKTEYDKFMSCECLKEADQFRGRITIPF